MNLQIERPYIEALISECPRLTPLREQLRFGSKVTLPFHQFSGAELGFLGKLYREAGPAMRTRATQLATLQQAFDGRGTRFGPDDDLEMLMPAIARHLTTDALRGWLFRVNVSDKPLAYVVTRLDFIAPSAAWNWNGRTSSIKEALNKSSPRRCAVVTALAVYNRGLPLAGESRGPVPDATGFRHSPE